MAFDLKLAGKSQVIGLSKSHRATVEFPHTIGFSRAHKDVAPQPFAVLPMVALFEHFHFVGGCELTFMNWRYVGDWWVDKISSLLIISGTWDFYSEPNYQGDRWEYGPGLYDEVTSKISSFLRHDA